ncbi:MAG: diguanylate cyclase (GGDEF)-like protein/PAS domain S-box-containing protein [Candidatus Poriferisodalaceae bacterium]|jgi:diguanylate cyclase (GGDEF)-like protein/PAS domain S-box-containing protein
MIRLGSQRFVALSVAILGGAAFGGETGVGVAFVLLGFMAVAALISGVRNKRPEHGGVWWLLATGLMLFLTGGIVGEIMAPAPDTTPSYPGWREPFDLAAYVTILGALWSVGRARAVHRDRTITLDALVTVLGIGSIAWATIMLEYLGSPDLTTAGKMTGVTFSLITLALGFATIRLAIGAGARPVAYYLLAGAAAGGLVAEVFVEMELVGWSPFPGTEALSTIASAVAFVLIGAAALHPSMNELTLAPVDPTPVVTRARLGLMTVAVLIPPGLLLVDQGEYGRLNAAILIGLWGATSLMVMVRIASLALAREKVAHLERISAEAELAVATATTPESRVSSVLEAAALMIPEMQCASLHYWTGNDWELVSQAGGGTCRPLDAQPRSPDSPIAERTGRLWHMDVHTEATGRACAVLAIEASRAPSQLEKRQVASLLNELSHAMEAETIRELMSRDRYERRFRVLVENSTDIIFVLDGDSRIQFVTAAGPRLLDVGERDLVGSTFADLVEHSDQQPLNALADGTLDASVQLQLRAGDGRLRWFDVRSSDMATEPDIAGVVVTATEISAQKQAELDLRRSEARFRSLVQHASDLVMVLDADGLISWVSPAVTAVLGYTTAAVVDREFSHLVFEGDRRNLDYRLSALDASSSDAGSRFEINVRDAGNEWRVLEARLTDLRGDPNVEGVVLNAHDITDRKRLEETLRHQVLHDALTGIPNRVLFADRVGQALASRSNDGVAVIVLDLDDFKTVNDGLGHSVGDEVLKVLAFRLQQHVRPSDTAARLGGDEFAVLLADHNTPATAQAICERLLNALEEPIVIDDRELILHASAGVTLAGDIKQPTADTMLRNADVAMYASKSSGKSRVTVFDSSMHEGAFERLELKADLAHALERNELALHYQPFVDMESGLITGFEALMRWHHPERGMVSPGTFIPLAEETGLILPIGRWLLNTAFGQVKEWQQLNAQTTSLTMSVNVSGRQLEDDDIVSDLAVAIAKAGINPTTVIMELTESIAVEDDSELVDRLHDIRALGVGLHADDFGAGYATYSALQSLPFTGVKIDRSLVSGLDGPTPDRAEAQVRSIIDMAAATGMHVVAEGIESAAQVQVLRRLRCDTAQGFYFARPADAVAAAVPLHAAVTSDESSGGEQLVTA